MARHRENWSLEVPWVGLTYLSTGVPLVVSGSYIRNNKTSISISISRRQVATHGIELHVPFPLGELDFLLFDGQIHAESVCTTGLSCETKQCKISNVHAPRDFAAVVAVADVTASFVAEEVVVIDFDGDGWRKVSTVQ